MRYAELYQQEDCSIGNHSQGMPATTPTGEANNVVLDPLRDSLRERIGIVNQEVAQRLKPDQLEAIFEDCQKQVVAALDQSKNDWKALFPGKLILQRFAKEHDLGPWPALQNLTIEAMAEMRSTSVSDLRRIFQRIAGTAAA